MFSPKLEALKLFLELFLEQLSVFVISLLIEVNAVLDEDVLTVHTLVFHYIYIMAVRVIVTEIANSAVESLIIGFLGEISISKYRAYGAKIDLYSGEIRHSV